MRPLKIEDFKKRDFDNALLLHTYQSGVYSCPLCGLDATDCRHNENEMYAALSSAAAEPEGNPPTEIPDKFKTRPETKPTTELPTEYIQSDKWLLGLAGDSAARKQSPIFEGLLSYFPNACAYLAFVSRTGNEQHNPGQPMHWAFDKSTDHGDCILRHQAEVGTVDTDGVRHAGKVFWRAAAQLETELLRAYPELKPGRNVKGFTR